MIFAQTPTVSLIFEGLALSYRRLMSIGRHVANLDALILFLFPQKEKCGASEGGGRGTAQ